MSPSLLAVLLTAWPAAGAPLAEPSFTPPARRLRIVIDAGHGAPGNEGNHGCACQLEQAHTLVVARHLAFVLAQLGGFEVRLARDGGTPSYKSRVRAAEAFRADAIVSLHSDARGMARPWTTGDGGALCYRNDDAPGFSVLWSDEGTTAVVSNRARLGRAVGRHLRAAGFGAYSGVDYGGLYRNDEVEPTGWIDKRPTRQRVYMLRASAIPTVIVETHHALDPQEVARWDEPRTIDVFALAVAAALGEALAPPKAPGVGAAP